MTRAAFSGRVVWLILCALNALVAVVALRFNDAHWSLAQGAIFGFCVAACIGRLR